MNEWLANNMTLADILDSRVLSILLLLETKKKREL